MPSQLIWWEKTVEYKFILDGTLHENPGLEFAAPLSGAQENGGDGIFAKNSKIILIEFKRSKNELASEPAKFGLNYDKAKQALHKIDTHHFLVFGSCDNGTLRLHAQTYFSGKKSNAMAVFEHGVPPEDFKAYINKLLELKKPDGRSMGTVSYDSMASVFGLSSDGKTCMSITLSNYCEQVLSLNIEQGWEPDSTPSPHGPTF